MGARCCCQGVAATGGAVLFHGPDWAHVPVTVASVYDGDTVVCDIPIARGTYRFRCRLAGIDAPEMRPPRTDAAPQIKQAALASRDHLERLLGGRTPASHVASFAGTDKYGRPLVTFGTVNQRMILDGHAVPYDGRTKAVPFPDGGTHRTALRF